MIIDEIIALIFELFGFLLEGLASLFGAVINGILYIFELIVGIFVTGYSTKRVKPYKRNKANKANKENQKQSNNKTKYGLFIVIAFIAAIFIIPIFSSMSYRDITFVAKDGHSLPFASVVIYREDSTEHRRTKNDGSLHFKKHGLIRIEVNDKRYKKISWNKDEIDDILIVNRTILGSGLDIFANKLLNKD